MNDIRLSKVKKSLALASIKKKPLCVDVIQYNESDLANWNLHEDHAKSIEKCFDSFDESEDDSNSRNKHPLLSTRYQKLNSTTVKHKKNYTLLYNSIYKEMNERNKSDIKYFKAGQDEIILSKIRGDKSKSKRIEIDDDESLPEIINNKVRMPNHLRSKISCIKAMSDLHYGVPCSINQRATEFNSEKQVLKSINKHDLVPLKPESYHEQKSTMITEIKPSFADVLEKMQKKSSQSPTKARSTKESARFFQSNKTISASTAITTRYNLSRTHDQREPQLINKPARSKFSISKIIKEKEKRIKKREGSKLRPIHRSKEYIQNLEIIRKSIECQKRGIFSPKKYSNDAEGIRKDNFETTNKLLELVKPLPISDAEMTYWHLLDNQLAEKELSKDAAIDYKFSVIDPRRLVGYIEKSERSYWKLKNKQFQSKISKAD